MPMAIRTFEITEDQYEVLAEEYGGICLACGEIQHGGVEPDAEGFERESCGEPKVQDIEQAMSSGHIAFSDAD
jgi:hypothetical protein